MHWLVIIIGTLILSISVSNPFYKLIIGKKIQITSVLQIIFRAFLFIIGLVLGPIFYVFFTKIDIPFLITSSLPIIITAGFLVGIGTKIGRGCTSGHGICGISLLSARSIIATIIFMITAIITVKLIG